MVGLSRSVKAWLLGRIEGGDWPEGTRIPSEAQLCERFGASRMTVSRAVGELAAQGYLRRVRGSGTYVGRVALNAALLEIRSIREEIEARGGRHSAEVLRHEAMALPPEAAQTVGLPVGTRVVRHDCLHRDGARPVQLEERWVNARIAPGFAAQDFTVSTASDVLLATVSYTSGEHTVTAVAADTRIARLLDIAPGAPCLRLGRRTFQGADPITHVTLTHPGEGFRLAGALAGSVPRAAGAP